MIDSHKVTNSEFHAGDDVVLAEGPYQGTPGVFLHLTKDAAWAEIEERNGQAAGRRVRAHPVIWLKRLKGTWDDGLEGMNGQEISQAA